MGKNKQGDYAKYKGESEKKFSDLQNAQVEDTNGACLTENGQDDDNECDCGC